MWCLWIESLPELVRFIDRIIQLKATLINYSVQHGTRYEHRFEFYLQVTIKHNMKITSCDLVGIITWLIQSFVQVESKDMKIAYTWVVFHMQNVRIIDILINIGNHNILLDINPVGHPKVCRFMLLLSLFEPYFFGHI